MTPRDQQSPHLAISRQLPRRAVVVDLDDHRACLFGTIDARQVASGGSAHHVGSLRSVVVRCEVINEMYTVFAV